MFDTQPWLAGSALLGIILTAAYVLRSVLKVTFGPLHERFAALRDARLIEAVPMIVLLAFILLLGCFPSVLTDTLQYSIEELFRPLITSGMGG
ncbi:NADH:ubiquinone oxidoreductase subunit M [compost metagenome]